MNRLPYIDPATKLEELDAVKRGHFRLSSGRHSDTYIQCAKILQYPRVASDLIYSLVERLPQADVIVSPAIGGIIFGCLLALQLDCRMIFAERVEGKFALRRDFCIVPGEKAMIAEDVVTTGGSVLEIAELVRQQQGEIVGIAALVDRGEKPDMQYPLFAMTEITATSYPVEDCPLCRGGVPIDAPGSRYL